MVVLLWPHTTGPGQFWVFQGCRAGSVHIPDLNCLADILPLGKQNAGNINLDFIYLPINTRLLNLTLFNNFCSKKVYEKNSNLKENN